MPFENLLPPGMCVFLSMGTTSWRMMVSRSAVRDLLSGLNGATVVEDYSTFPKGPAVLVLQFDGNNRPIHVVWGIPRGFTSPAVLVTAYRPDPAKWNEHFTER